MSNGSANNNSKAFAAQVIWYVLLGTALLLRLLTAARSWGFQTDLNCFIYWADQIYKLGPGGFYSADFFSDYPPGYLYVLYPIGAVMNKAGLTYFGSAQLMLIRLPAILSDCISSILLHREASKRLSPLAALLVGSAYLFNPAVICNSSHWGQVDSVFTLALLSMCLALISGNLSRSYIAYGAALLLKPQALLFAPVILLAFLDQTVFNGFSSGKFFRELGKIGLTVLGMLLLCLPFGLGNVFSQYFSTVGSYPYASVGAYNLWTLAGQNWVSQDNLFLGIPFRAWGTLMILLAVAGVVLLSFRRKNDRTKYPFLCAFFLISIFMFSVRMHERYLYPAMCFLLLAFLYQPAKQLLFCYFGFSLLHYLNLHSVLLYYNPREGTANPAIVSPVCAGMLLMTLYFYYCTIKLYCGSRPVVSAAPAAVGASAGKDTGILSAVRRLLKPTAPVPSSSLPRPGRTDWCIMLVIAAVYSCFALYDLGDMQAPATSMELTQDQELVFDFDGRVPAVLHYYIAPWQERLFRLEEKDAGDSAWRTCDGVTLQNVFTWQEVALTSKSSILRFTLLENQASLLELVFTDADGNVLTAYNADSYPALFDEQSLLPERSSFRNSMYFDEIYHARTAYEFLHGLASYENTHPPLGKILIAAGISLFGMNPFGWRIVGTVFGIAMVFVSYLFARRLTQSTPAAALACMLFSFDFMHFTQTRIATIDVYITFFVMAMYLFMLRYARMSFYDTALKRTFLPLGACGVCMGLGIACKWTGVYAGLGLAVIFFATLFRRYREYLYAAQTPKASTNGIRHKDILSSFRPYTVKTILFCLVFFVAIPAVIYVLSYLPFRDYTGNGVFMRMLENQNTMFSYHSSLNATHPYSSSWYEWPIIKRPIWYFSAILTGTAGSGGLREGISAFGNPLVWWAGIPAFFCTVYLWGQKKDRNAAFLVIGYLAQYLPWFFVTRITFIYHYFPSVIFAVLMIVYCLSQCKPLQKKRRFLIVCCIYAAAVFFLFCLFYPVLSGQPVEADFVAKWLRWFKSWVLVSG